jgi:chromosome segregation ATPase
MSAANDRGELERTVTAVERDLEVAATQAREAEDALERLKANEAEATGRLALASRAKADLEQRLAQLQGALREADRETAKQAFREAVATRDRCAEEAAEAIARALAAIAAVDDAHVAIEQSVHEGAMVGAELRHAPPGDPAVFAEEWSRLEQLVRQKSQLQLEQDLVEAAAASPMGHAIKDLPEHLQVLARERRLSLRGFRYRDASG